MRSALAMFLLASAAAASDAEDAWEAYRIAEEGIADDVAWLRGKLDHGNTMVVDAVWDALIQRKAKLPWKELKPRFGRKRTEVLILLAQHPEHYEDALLEILPDTGGLHWRALCNLLVAQKAKGVAAHLLAGLELKLEVRIGSRLGGGGTHRAGIGCGQLTVPEGWPPTVRYSLDDHEGEDTYLLAPGDEPVYYRRKLYGPGTHGVGGTLHWDDRDHERRARYLARLLDTTPEELGLGPVYRLRLKQRDDEAVAGKRREIEQSYEKLQRRLIDAGLLGARVEPKVELDYRKSTGS